MNNPFVEHCIRSHSSVKKFKILVIDDDDIVRQAIQLILSSLGYQTCLAATLEDGIKLYTEALQRKARYDLVITDLSFEGIPDGIKTVDVLKKIDPFAKVIVFSGYSYDPVIRHYSDYGFVGSITKPFTIEDVQKSVDKAMRQ